MIGSSSSLSFAGKQPTVKGIFSVVLSAIALCICVAAVIVSYKSKGNAGQFVGSCGIMALLFAAMGLGFGIGGLLEGGRRRVLSIVGTVIGAVIFLGLMILFVNGF